MESGPPAPPHLPRSPRLPAWRLLGLATIAAVPSAAAVIAAEGEPALLQPVLRVAFVYLLLLLGFRLLGKRELGQLSQFELVTLMLIPEVVSPALNADDPSMRSAVVGVCTLFTLVTGTALLAHLSPRAARAFEGRPTVLVRDGAVLAHAMNRERISPEELHSAMHQAGLERLAQVKWAILEPGGRIAFIPVAPGTAGGAEPAVP